MTVQMENHNIKEKILQKAYIKNNDMYFESSNGFEKAIKDGFFLLKIPDYIDLSPGISLSKSFYKDFKSGDFYTGFKNKEKYIL